MGIGKGNVSHNAVLADLDLGVGSLRQRAVYNRLGTTGGNMSLSNHRGVACGSQLNSFSLYDQVSTNTNTGYGGYYPSMASGNNYVSGTSIVLKAAYSGGGGPDGSSEHRTNFKITESGQYRITGTTDWTGQYTYYNTYWKVCVVACDAGYLQGNLEMLLNYESGVYGNDGITNVNQTFNLSTNKRYGTLILYAIRIGGGDASKPDSTAIFNNYRVAKT
jgi:hypothetical protein